MPRPYDVVKRLLDIVLSAVALILLSPVLVVLAVAIAHNMGRPVLFRQERAGRYGVPFPLIKFRSMRDGAGPDRERITPLGAFLRSTSLDELPELRNVFLGHMSLVGPRPLPVSYLDRYAADEIRRHDVRPGLTGWSQVCGRNATTWDDRLANDLFYVKRRSFALDVKIMWRTVKAVLKRTGIDNGEGVTMHELTDRGEIPRTSWSQPRLQGHARSRSLWRIAGKSLCDAACWVVALMVAVTLRFDFQPSAGSFASALRWGVGVACAHVALGTLLGVYPRRWRFGSLAELRMLALMTLVVGLGATMVVTQFDPQPLPRSVPVSAAVVALVLMAGARAWWRSRVNQVVTHRADARRAIVYGAGPRAELVMLALQRDELATLVPVAVIDDDPDRRGMSVGGLVVRGDRHHVDVLAAQHRADVLLLAEHITASELRELELVASNAGLAVVRSPLVIDLTDGASAPTVLMPVRS
jgi:lipopolysaccharide/colanic/teichoic acid biosynthesis glycosyltransferase